MAKRIRDDYLLLIRGQVPYRGTWKDVYEQKCAEMRTNFISTQVGRAMREAAKHPPSVRVDTSARQEIALWFYKGTSAKPHDVATFVYWYDSYVKHHSVVELVGAATSSLTLPAHLTVDSFRVCIYFPNEFDWYVQSCAEFASLDYEDDPNTAQTFSQRQVTKISRKNYHDPPGRNALLLTNVHKLTSPMYGSSRSLNLAEYEICRGHRLGMNARDYFADSKSGQRVACLKRVKTNDPAHLIQLHIGALLAFPYALSAKRI